MQKRKLRAGSATVLIILGILINMAGSKLAIGLGWWLFLDSAGTILASALGGILPGVIVGFVSNSINGLSDPITLYYGLISVLIAAVAVFLSRKGAFRHLSGAVLGSLPLAIIGGGLGSLLTWMLFGLNVGNGISAPLTQKLIASANFSPLVAQFTADMAIDIADKLITMLIVFAIIRLLPEKLINYTPCGRYCLDGFPPTKKINGKKIHSLRGRIVLMIGLTALVLSTIAVTISFLIYKDTMDNRFISTGNSVADIMVVRLSGDDINRYLSEGESARGYAEDKSYLEQIRSSVPEIKYMYVYRICEDGCHVVFDLDTEDTPGAPLGSVQKIDDAFRNVLPDLLAGKEIKPIIANGSFGWLLTVYKPIYDSSGNCSAYAAVDIDMADVLASRYTFIIRMISLLFGASIIIISLTVIYAQKRFVDPIEELAEATEHFAFDSDSMRRENTDMIQNLKLSADYEVTKLYQAISKTVTDLSGYIDQIAERNSYIAKMQDNIIMSFAGMVENRDENTGLHIKRTAAYVGAIGAELIREGKYPDKIDPEKLSDYVKSAPLHDIGKIRISDAILNKPGRLTPEEFEIIKTHTTSGGEILREALEGIEGNSYLHYATEMAICHHEWYNGKGYPSGISGNSIPLCARIMAIADVFDALVTRRSYKEAYDFDKAVDIIKEESGSHFDPVIVDAFLNILPEIKALTETQDFS